MTDDVNKVTNTSKYCWQYTRTQYL